MKAKVYRVAGLIVALLVAVFTVGYAFAWVFNRRDADLKLSGSSAGAYFESGNGSQEKPFVISTSTHMRNLAVLQNNGRFVNADGKPAQFYFEIKKTVSELNMNGRYIPPIGNDEYPFIGKFNGNGKTIKNLHVTTDKLDLSDDYPVQSGNDYAFSRAVGLFGMTGKGSVIRNFILDNPTVTVAGENTLYATAAKQVVGIAVGHVEGKCSSIGVRAADEGASLNVEVTGYSTFNSILGELGEGVESSVTGGGHGNGSGGSGASFGSSFDVASMLDRLYLIKENKQSSSPSFHLPDIDTQNQLPTPSAGSKIAFSVDAGKSTYEGADAIETVSSQNVGYFLGNQNKFNVKKLSFGERLIETDDANRTWTDSNGKTPDTSGKVPLWFYKYTDYITENTGTVYTSATGFTELSQSEMDELPQGVKDLLPLSYEQKSYTTIRISQNWGYSSAGANYGNDNNDQWSYHGQISWMGNTYGEGFRNADNKAVDENGNELDGLYVYNNRTFNAFTGGIALPNNAVWFKPAQVGKFRFIMYADTNGEGFVLQKITRENATEENPFNVDPNEMGQDVKLEVVMMQKIPKNVLLYYEYEVKEEDLSSEFMLKQQGDGGAYFLYLDIGASAAEDISGIVDDKAVSAVDFIYDGVTISEEENEEAGIKIGDFIVNASGTAALYEASKTSVYFEEAKSILKMVYLRLYGRDDKKTLDISSSQPLPSKTGDAKATVPAYVIPDVGGGSGGGTSGGNVAVTAVLISTADDAYNLEVGGTLELFAAVLPVNATDQTVVWAVINGSGAAEISSDGVLTATKAGNVTVTATAGGVTASREITIDGGEVEKSVTYTYSIASKKPVVSDNAAGTIEVTGFNTANVTGEGEVSENAADYKFTGNAYTVTITLTAKAGQNVAVKVTGFTGSTNNAVGVNVEMANGTMTSANKEIEFSSTSSTTARESGTVEFTVTADGEIVITLTRSKGNTTRVTDIEIVVG